MSRQLLGTDNVVSIANGPQLPNHIKFGEFCRDEIRPIKSLKSYLTHNIFSSNRFHNFVGIPLN